jgi:SAM-dependent MidA family methyltransferase
MQLALYALASEYYSGGAAKFSRKGDFVTAPEMSPLYGRALARQGAQVLELTGGDILEFGAGTGKLAFDLLLELEKLDSLPARYFILEVSAELQQRQRELFERCAHHLLSRVIWLEYLPEHFNGLIVANEVLDAMPVHLLVWRGAQLFERGVTLRNNGFDWGERPLTEGADRELLAAARRLPVHFGSGADMANQEYVSEINLSARHFMHTLGNLLERGVILLIDYGFGEGEYYHPQRNHGTLMCHYRHRLHDNPFYLPGLQDITSHVDFSAIANAGLELWPRLAWVRQPGCIPDRLRHPGPLARRRRSRIRGVPARSGRGTEADVACRNGRTVQGSSVWKKYSGILDRI